MRGALIGQLSEFIGKASQLEETCVWDATVGAWRICYTYGWESEGFVPERHWCYWADDPEPPPPLTTHEFSWCPGTDYPDVAQVVVTNAGGPPCPCADGLPHPMTWDGALGTEGGWRAIYSGCGVGGIEVEVWPIGGGGGTLHWELRVSSGGMGISQYPISTCGSGVSVPIIPVLGPACPGSNVAVAVTF